MAAAVPKPERIVIYLTGISHMLFTSRQASNRVKYPAQIVFFLVLLAVGGGSLSARRDDARGRVITLLRLANLLEFH